MERFDFNNVFDRYAENNSLLEFDIFHLYDTGRECAPDNSGYVDSRHFSVVAFNTKSMQKRSLGLHDGMDTIDNIPFSIARVYADGSFLIRFRYPVMITMGQCIFISNPDTNIRNLKEITQPLNTPTKQEQHHGI